MIKGKRSQEERSSDPAAQEMLIRADELQDVRDGSLPPD
jgi:hypothetical protein